MADGPASPPTDDVELARAVIGGDNAAFGAFYGRYARPVHDYVLGIVRDRNLAEDVTQATFLRAFEQRASVRDPGAARAWLYRIAHNVAISQVSRTARIDELPDDAPLAATDADPGHLIEQRDAAQLVWDAAASLEPRQFAVLDLTLRQGLSSTEMGDVLGLDAAQASLALHRAREALGNAVRYLLVARRRRHCERLSELVPASVRTLSVEQRATVDRHMRRCADCQRAALVLTAPGQLFGTIPIALLPAALREWHTPAIPASPSVPQEIRPALSPRPWALGAVGAAAVVVAVTAIIAVTSRGSPPNAGRSAAPVTATAGTATATAATAAATAAATTATASAALAAHTFTPAASVAANSYYAASCPTSTTCLAVGKDATGHPILSTTTDSGTTWRTSSPSVSYALGLITCTSPAHCVGAQNTGHGDTFVVSDDAGATWQPASAPPLTALQSASCPTANDCLAVGGDERSGLAESVASTDGGHSWHLSTAPGPAVSLDCLDDTHCWAVGTRAWFSGDLGHSWRAIDVPTDFDQATGAPSPTGTGPRVGPPGILLNGVAFGSATDGIIFGGAQCGGLRITQCASALFSTHDGGASWTFWAPVDVTTYGDGNFAACRGSSCLLVTDTFTHSVLASTTDGTAWTTRQTFDGYLTGLTCDPSGSTCLGLATTGIYLTHDN